MLTEPLLSPNGHFAVWAIIMGLASFAFWIDGTKIGRNISGVAIVIITAMAMSNLNIIPKQAPAYDMVWFYLVPLAVPLLLLKADLRRLIPEAKGMFIAFLLGTIGTLLGAILGFCLLPLGEQANNLAGIFSATYIGGSMNMVVVAQAVELDNSLMSAAVAADNVVGVVYLVLLAIMPAFTWLRCWLPSGIIDRTEQQSQMHVEHVPKAVNLNLLHLCLALALGLVICAAGKVLASQLGIGSYSILFITALTVAVANLFPKQMATLEGDHELGVLMMYLFFAVVGAGADIAKLLDSALVIALFAATIITCHMLVIFIGSRFFKLDLAEVIIASNACTGGPASAVALAAGKGWRELLTPAVIVGVFGYVVANFLGVTIAVILP